jgi:serralysin
MPNNDQWCFAWVALPAPTTGAPRAALLKGAKWNPGDRITVSFLDGDAGVQEKVKAAALARTAPGMANLKFEFRDGPDTLIRISFKYRGSWSVIGTTCKQITDKTQPTMNFGWLNASSSSAEIERVVLHEFGHALGLVHEHQNPGGIIHWNREQVINSLSGYPNYWTLDVIELNMFRAYAVAETNFTDLDPQSIMMYPLPASWTTDGFSAGLNSTLSATDKKFIQRQHP